MIVLDRDHYRKQQPIKMKSRTYYKWIQSNNLCTLGSWYTGEEGQKDYKRQRTWVFYETVSSTDVRIISHSPFLSPY